MAPKGTRSRDLRALFDVAGIPCLLLATVIGQFALELSHRTTSALLLLVAMLAWGLLVRGTFLGRIPTKVLLITFGVAVAAAVALPPATSKDVNSYALYGRMVADYHASPYLSVPRDFAADPWFSEVSYYWNDSPSVYGALFNFASGAIMEVADFSIIKARMGFQILEGVGLVAATALLCRRMRSPLPVALIGLNPLSLAFGVNDAHCDMLIGLFVLCGALLAMHNRSLFAGALLGLAAMVKVAALPAIGGLALWTWIRRSFNRAVQAVFGFVLVFAVGLLAAGGLAMFHPLSTASNRHTRFSVWAPLHGGLTELLGSGLPTQAPADGVVSLLASLTVLGVGLALILHFCRSDNPVLAITAGLVTYQVLGGYTLAWYVLWSLPALVLVWRSWLATVALLHATWLAIAYLDGYVAVGVLVVAAVWVWLRRKNGKSSLPWLDVRSIQPV